MKRVERIVEEKKYIKRIQKEKGKEIRKEWGDGNGRRAQRNKTWKERRGGKRRREKGREEREKKKKRKRQKREEVNTERLSEN